MHDKSGGGGEGGGGGGICVQCPMFTFYTGCTKKDNPTLTDYRVFNYYVYRFSVFVFIKITIRLLAVIETFMESLR